MMRKLKVIYLIPVYIVLLGGGGFAGYWFMIKPQIAKVATAKSEWEAEQKKAKDAYQAYPGYLKAQEEGAQILIDKYSKFHAIQNRMPNLVNMKETYGAMGMTPQQAVEKWISIAIDPTPKQELAKWVLSFKMDNNKGIAFPTQPQTISLSPTFPEVKLIEVQFPTQTVRGYGYADLVNKLALKSRVGNFPMYISPASSSASADSFTIELDNRVPYNPQRPLLKTNFTAKAYCMTRNWDPNGATAAQKIAEAQALVASPPMPKTLQEFGRASFDTPCPRVLWIIEPQVPDTPMQ